MESFWAAMKRAPAGVCRKMSPKRLDRYVHESSGRHNIRPVDTLNQMGMVVRGFEGKSLPYAVLKARPERTSIS